MIQQLIKLTASLRYKIALNDHGINEKHKVARLNWARENVLFSDEA